MPGFYNLTNLTGSGDFTGLIAFSNEVTDGWFGIGLLITIFAVFFISAKRFETEQAFTVAIFGAGVSSVFLGALGVVSNQVTLTMLALVVISVLVLTLRKRFIN